MWETQVDFAHVFIHVTKYRRLQFTACLRLVQFSVSLEGGRVLLSVSNRVFVEDIFPAVSQLLACGLKRFFHGDSTACFQLLQFLPLERWMTADARYLGFM